MPIIRISCVSAIGVHARVLVCRYVCMHTSLYLRAYGLLPPAPFLGPGAQLIGYRWLVAACLSLLAGKSLLVIQIRKWLDPDMDRKGVQMKPCGPNLT